MPKEFQVAGMDFEKLRKLPVVVELTESGKTSRYLIDDPKAFYNDPAYPRAVVGTDKYYSSIALLLKEHGRQIFDEEFDSGSVALSCMLTSDNRIYKEYRFQSPE